MELMEQVKFASSCLCFKENCPLQRREESQLPLSTQEATVTKDKKLPDDDTLKNSQKWSISTLVVHDQANSVDTEGKKGTVTSTTSEEEEPPPAELFALGDALPKRTKKPRRRGKRRSKRIQDLRANKRHRLLLERAQEDSVSCQEESLYDHCKMHPRPCAVEAYKRIMASKMTRQCLYKHQQPHLDQQAPDTVGFYFEPLGREVQLPRFDIHPLYMHPLDLMARLFPLSC